MGHLDGSSIPGTKRSAIGAPQQWRPTPTGAAGLRGGLSGRNEPEEPAARKKKERKKKGKPSPLLKNKSDERSRKKGNKRTENGRPTAGLEQHAGTGAGTQQVISKSDADATHTHTLPPNTSSAFCIEHGVGEFSGLIGSAFAPVRIRTNDEWRSREKDARFETDNHRETRNTEGKKTVESINQAHLHPTESKRRMMNGRHPNKSRPN